MHVSFDEFIINHARIKKQINGLHIPIKNFYNLNFSRFFLCNITTLKKTLEINMEIMIGIWYFLFEDKAVSENTILAIEMTYFDTLQRT